MLRFVLSFSVFFLVVLQMPAQGCSDAGVCTAGAAQPEADASDSVKKEEGKTMQFRLGGSYGIGEQSTNIIQITPEINLQLSGEFFLQARLPFTAVKGNLGSASGIGDLTTALLYEYHKSQKRVWTFSAGIKVATGKAMRSFDGKPLPMPYQTSLGTNDVIGGLALRYGKWHLATGYQQVIAGQNRNGFLHSAWAADSAAQLYFESKDLRRGNDALFRIERIFEIKNLRFTPGILAIYRLSPDQVRNESGYYYTVKGSAGLTLNLTATVRYRYSDKLGIGLIAGTPVIVRESRPDGLTRAAVFNLEISYSFVKKSNHER